MPPSTVLVTGAGRSSAGSWLYAIPVSGYAKDAVEIEGYIRGFAVARMWTSRCRASPTSSGRGEPPWYRELAGLLAFVRRRCSGDYAVDEFGFDPDLTKRRNPFLS